MKTTLLLVFILVSLVYISDHLRVHIPLRGNERYWDDHGYVFWCDRAMCKGWWLSVDNYVGEKWLYTNY